jgi:trans-aconitate methyltransferase
MVSDSIPFPSESFALLAAVEADHWWFRARNQVLLWVLSCWVEPFNALLEVGCGTGFVLEGISQAYPQAHLYGSEFFEEGLIFARQRIPSATFTQLDARLLQEQDRYDVIGAFDVIEHIEEDVLVLENLTRALKSAGNLLITVPQHPWLWSTVDEHVCHVRRYSRRELVRKVRGVGLKVEYVTSFVSLLVPLMALARLRANTTNYDPMAELRISPWLNRSLEAVMAVELRLLQVGITLPIGGSLLLLARKL